MLDLMAVTGAGIHAQVTNDTAGVVAGGSDAYFNWTSGAMRLVVIQNYSGTTVKIKVDATEVVAAGTGTWYDYQLADGETMRLPACTRVAVLAGANDIEYETASKNFSVIGYP